MFVYLLGLSHHQRTKLGLGVALLFLYIGFWLDLIKISLQRFGFVSSVFTVVLGRYRLQRLKHSGAECSFRTSLGLRTLY